MSVLDLKTWGFLIYPEGNDKEENSFEGLMIKVLVEGIIPLAEHFLQGYFSPRGPVHQVYCRVMDFMREQLKEHGDLQNASLDCELIEGKWRYCLPFEKNFLELGRWRS
jgi:hypothetical protein